MDKDKEDKVDKVDKVEKVDKDKVNKVDKVMKVDKVIHQSIVYSGQQPLMTFQGQKTFRVVTPQYK